MLGLLRKRKCAPIARSKPRRRTLTVEKLEDRNLMSLTIDTFSMPAHTQEGQNAGFTATASGGVGPLTYTWDFGDGASQSGVDLRVVNRAYDTNSPATTPYNVTLTVSDGATSVSQTGAILVSNLGPTGNAGASQSVQQGSTVTLNGQAGDPGALSDYTVEWDLDYKSGTFNADAVGTLSPSRLYDTAGTYAIALRVTDDAGESTLAFSTVDVRPADDRVQDPLCDLLTPTQLSQAS